MKKLYKVNVFAEQKLSLTAKILLIFERKEVEVQNLNLEYQDDKKRYCYHFLVSSSYENIEKTTRLIAKQIGVEEANFN